MNQYPSFTKTIDFWPANISKSTWGYN
jgi:hypothetical protein